MKQKLRSKEHTLKFFLHEQGLPIIQNTFTFTYNSKYGLMMDEEFFDFKLKNVTNLYFIISPNKTLYISVDGLTFADIIYKK